MKVGANSPIYLHGDHLGSTSATSGATNSAQNYYPFGSIRTTTGSVPTDFRFTGQRRDASSNLMYYGARYYDTTVGRFISADTMVPQAGDPQALNRYSYVGNNPLKYTDPSGHCWGAASGARSLPSYDVTCGNLDMALTIVQHPNANAVEKAFAGWYLATEGTAHVALAVGGGILAWEAIAPAAAVAEAACGDGDCTNEAKAVGHAVHTTNQSALSLARQIASTPPNSTQTQELTNQLAKLSTNGGGTRVVLGQDLADLPTSYHHIAQQSGGIFYRSAAGVYDALGRSRELAWNVNAAFLRQQLMNGVARFDFVNLDIAKIRLQYATTAWEDLPMRVRELFYLTQHAKDYGYIEVGNSFILK